ncbi:MAG TPA: DM13 domain-containing protein [Mycobacteriales bacterium]|nr:DM13 domain-containing protein [Mycobacteriales bacterium]
MGRLTRQVRKPVVLALGAVAVLVAGAGLALFQPWKLWVDTTVNEAVPTASASQPVPSGRPVPSGQAVRPDGAAGRSTAPAGGPVTLASGQLISHEHATSGTVRIVGLPDGSRVLRLESLDTSNGPDLRVWLTDAPVIRGSAGWHVFDDGGYLSLGRLKGNKGNQNYPLPADLDLSRYVSVTIWCDRFNVSFGAATLTGT